MASKISQLKTFLEKIIKLLDLQYTEIEADESKEDKKIFYKFNVSTLEPQTLIGHHGEVLFSLQQILRMHAKKIITTKGEVRIILDIDNYRHNQEANASDIARHAVAQLIRTGQPVKLVNMPSYKRRSIHHTIAEEFDNVETISEGDGENRHVILKLKNK